MPVISTFLIDDDNEEKFWSHTLSVDQIIQVLDGPYLVVRNKKKHRASHLVIGTDNSGHCISIPIEPTNEDDVWRSVTAWLCGKGEATALVKARGKK